jgi:hypothetical protein
MKNKIGLEFGFGWMFAIIVGASIIFLAIYASTKLGEGEKFASDSEVAQRLGTLFNPLETSVEESKSSPPIVFPTEARIYSNCSDKDYFGNQIISVATKSGIGTAWQGTGVGTSLYNKYIFLNSGLEGKEFYVFSEPFEMQFKIANLIFLWSDKERYCFVGQSKKIEEEVLDLGLINIAIENSTRKCDSKTENVVCFNNPNGVKDSDCYASVDEIDKTVTKKGKTVYYQGSLIYGAIFSNPKEYECQVKRIMKRASAISSILLEKSKYVSVKNSGCGSSLQPLLTGYINQTIISGSEQLKDIYIFSERLKEANNALGTCKVF